MSCQKIWVGNNFRVCLYVSKYYRAQNTTGSFIGSIRSEQTQKSTFHGDNWKAYQSKAN